jgi:hypothetical protein
LCPKARRFSEREEWFEEKQGHPFDDEEEAPHCAKYEPMDKRYSESRTVYGDVDEYYWLLLRRTMLLIHRLIFVLLGDVDVYLVFYDREGPSFLMHSPYS